MATAGDTPVTRRLAEFGEFLRTRCGRLLPADVGLPDSSRRRTPGLRREEVAQLCGVSPTYYAFLEQGRDIRPSGQVLDALARALRLSPAERAARALFTDWLTLPSRQRNELLWMFTNPQAHAVYIDWEKDAAAMLARFRLAAARRPSSFRYPDRTSP
jgi:transcriptional regulator with XRE-family HTH domain